MSAANSRTDQIITVCFNPGDDADWFAASEKVNDLMNANGTPARRFRVRHRKFIVTTDPNHRFRVYPNLAESMELTAINQLWVADITYVRLREAFVYLAVILDAFSRKVVGWAIADHLQASLALEALQMALDGREVARGGLVHHSDRGVQYACGDYIARLEAHGIQPSMSRVGCPYDNAMAESFMKTLKAEEVDGAAYRDLIDAKARIGQFIETVYNRQRLHSALRYCSPEEYEADQRLTPTIHSPVDRVPRSTATTTVVAY